MQIFKSSFSLGCGRLFYIASISIALLLSFSSAFAQDKDKLNLAHFNPKPSKDDIIVPMPCQGFMVFKKVYTSSNQESKLDDKSFYAGSNNSEALISQAPNHRYIQGSFHDAKGYYYLLAKYELNEAQYKILKAYNLGKGKCPSAFSIKDRIAKSNLSWFDAIELSKQYSFFLSSDEASLAVKSLKALKLNNVLIPKATDVNSSKNANAKSTASAYVRLPTDTEWEFAARGGLLVTSSQFAADLFPFEKGKTIEDYAWFKGQGSASDGKVRVIGLKEPNPLDLHDMLGNVSEMMLDPFYATRTGRLHGQSGGYIVRGGSVLNSKDDMTVAYRTERAFFTKGKETKGRDTGLRFVLTVPFTNSIQEVRDLNEQVKLLGLDDNQEDVKGGGNLNTIAELDKIIKEQQEAAKQYEADNQSLHNSVKTLNANLAQLRERMIEANAKKDEMRDRAIVSSLRLGGYLCSSLASQQITKEQNLKNEEIILRLPIPQCRNDENSKECKLAKQQQNEKLKANRELANSMVDFYASYYADHIVDTVDTFDFIFVKGQLENAKQALGNSNKSSLAEYISLFLKDIEQYQKGSRNLKANKERWTKQCRALKR